MARLRGVTIPNLMGARIGSFSHYARTAKQRASPAWRTVVAEALHAKQWLMQRRQMVFWAAAIGAVFVLMSISSGGILVWLWTKYSTHHEAISPLLTLLAGVAVATVALLRHFAQTDADRQRRITETFSKAIEQLGNDKVEVRLGGIYSLERISRESPSDYWTVIENMTAFARERSRRTEAERTERLSYRAYFMWLEAGQPEDSADYFWGRAIELDEFGKQPPTDIAAVVTVLARRGERGHRREVANNWRLDLGGANLRSASLREAHLKGANLSRAHLEGADLTVAHLEGADLSGSYLKGTKLDGAHLEGADLSGSYLEKALLRGAYLKGARLRGAHLERVSLGGAQLKGAYLKGEHLEKADLVNVHLEGADLREVHLEGAYLVTAHLDGADLRGAHLEGANLMLARLRGANVMEAHFEGANLTRARLEGVDLSGAHLKGATRALAQSREPLVGRAA